MPESLDTLVSEGKLTSQLIFTRPTIDDSEYRAKCDEAQRKWDAIKNEPPFAYSEEDHNYDMDSECPEDREYVVKDSGERKHFPSGMQRDVTTGKVDYLLALDGPMFERYAAHMTKGAEKYDKSNWLKAEGQEELDRFRESALRHMIQWLKGVEDEDHASGIWYNVNGAEYVKGRM